MSVKPYFWSKNTYNIKPDKLEAPLPTLEVPYNPIKPTKPTIKRGRGRPRKNPIIENYLTSVDTSVDISVK